MDTIKSDICKAAYELCVMLDEYFQRHNVDDFMDSVLCAIHEIDSDQIESLLAEVEIEENYAE